MRRTLQIAEGQLERDIVLRHARRCAVAGHREADIERVLLALISGTQS